MILKKIYAAVAAAAVSASVISVRFPCEQSNAKAEDMPLPIETNVSDDLSVPAADNAEQPTDIPQPTEPESAIKEYSVLEVIRIRRDLLAGGGKYTLADYKDVSSFLVNNSKKSLRYFTLSYDTEGCDTSAYAEPEELEPTEYYYKQYVKIIHANLAKEGYINTGWEYDGKFYSKGVPFRMPACNVVMKPVWVRRCTVSYNAGNYDDIVGNKFDSVTSAEGAQYFVSDSSRFSRTGYTISGWLCSYDGKEYKPGESIIIPSDDIIFEALWSPAVYDISLSANNGNVNDKVLLKGKYNEEFVFPECEFENNGKTFAGWKYNKEMYQPGDSFTIPAMASGKKIVIVAVWN